MWFDHPISNRVRCLSHGYVGGVLYPSRLFDWNRFYQSNFHYNNNYNNQGGITGSNPIADITAYRTAKICLRLSEEGFSRQNSVRIL